MRLPLAVVTRLAVHNLLAEHGFTMSVPDGSEHGAPADTADVPDLLSCIFAAQQRRVDKYHEFRRGFEALLADNNLEAYTALCARVAASFADISREVNDAGASLREAGRSDLFDAVRTLQQHEKEQLRLEATLQVLRKEHAAGRWSWQRQLQAVSLAGVAPRDVRPSWAANCRVHDAQQPSLLELAGDEPPVGCDCGVGEPTEEEYQGAVREATQARQGAVTGINEVLDELRQARGEE